MKKLTIAIIETSPKSDSTIDAHTRNSIILSEHLNKKHDCDLLFSNDAVLLKQYDFIIFSYASFYFDFRKFKILIENQKNCKYGWITNEYNLSPNSYFKNLISFSITGFPQSSKKITENQCSINLNTWLLKSKTKNNVKKHDLIYYGTFRVNREIYFRKYFKEKNIYVSTSSKNQKKFKNIDCNPIYIEKLNWTENRETLSLFNASLYIEDEFSNDNFTNIANRFYEALYCNTASFFDESCRKTIKQSNVQIDEFFIVNSTKEINEKIKSKDFKEKSLNQISINYKLAVQEKQDTLKQVQQFIENL